jgi:hypothetical protein
MRKCVDSRKQQTTALTTPHYRHANTLTGVHADALVSPDAPVLTLAVTNGTGDVKFHIDEHEEAGVSAASNQHRQCVEPRRQHT